MECDNDWVTNLLDYQTWQNSRVLWQIWWACIVFTVVGAVITFIALCYKALSESEGSINEAKDASRLCNITCKVWIPALCIATICSLVETFTPTTKEMVAIKVIPQIASTNNIEKIKGIGQDILGITADWLADIRKKRVSEKDK